MRKVGLVLLGAMIMLNLTGCSKDYTKLNGTAKGFGGEVTVEVKVKDGKIISVIADGPDETPSIGSKALDEVPKAISEANSTDVDVVTGATVTSKAIIYAVNNALEPDKYPYPIKEEEQTEDPEVVGAEKLYQGLGISNTSRVGPGKDKEGVQVYSINQVFASTLFDEDGKIISLFVDQLEVATPNYDGEGMPHFSGFPGQGGYNNDENHDEQIDGKTLDTEENFKAEVESWATKGQRGDSYVMGTGTWRKQMDKYQELFIGKTVGEVEEWFKKYCSDLNGRPLKEDSSKDEDKAKYEALSDDEKDMLVDVVSGATMSLNDSHGNIIEAIKASYENRKLVNIKMN